MRVASLGMSRQKWRRTCRVDAPKRKRRRLAGRRRFVPRDTSDFGNEITVLALAAQVKGVPFFKF